MNKNGRLKSLERVMAAKAEAALQPVHRAAAKVQQIEKRAAGLAEYRNHLIQASNDPSFAGALMAQADRLRHLHAAALRDLAAARVEMDKARARAASAVGRHHSVEALMERQAKEIELLELRKRMRGG